jgi:hypothetical protein
MSGLVVHGQVVDLTHDAGLLAPTIHRIGRLFGCVVQLPRDLSAAAERDDFDSGRLASGLDLGAHGRLSSWRLRLLQRGDRASRRPGTEVPARAVDASALPMTRHFVDTQDLSVVELRQVLELIDLLRTADSDGCTPPLLRGRSLALIFEEPSTRTRVSFDITMARARPWPTPPACSPACGHRSCRHRRVHPRDARTCGQQVTFGPVSSERASR